MEAVIQRLNMMKASKLTTTMLEVRHRQHTFQESQSFHPIVFQIQFKRSQEVLTIFRSIQTEECYDKRYLYNLQIYAIYQIQQSILANS